MIRVDLELVGGTGSIADADRCAVLVIGVGNLLMGDEGVGIHILRALEPGPVAPGVQLLTAVPAASICSNPSPARPS